MPTAAEFRSAATSLRSAADDSLAVADKMWAIGADHGVQGGRLETLVDRALTADALGAESLRQQCEELADLCVERAAICDGYAADVAAWEVRAQRHHTRYSAWLQSVNDPDSPDLLHPGTPPRRPDPPFTWVEI